MLTTANLISLISLIVAVISLICVFVLSVHNRISDGHNKISDDRERIAKLEEKVKKLEESLENRTINGNITTNPPPRIPINEFRAKSKDRSHQRPVRKRKKDDS
jgi:vacuolar-type H+-ATPase subunit I/STV1